jgi:hypothetical protein
MNLPETIMMWVSDTVKATAYIYWHSLLNVRGELFCPENIEIPGIFMVDNRSVITVRD